MKHSKLVDYFRTRLSYESEIRVYAKRIVQDTTSLFRTFLPWKHLETVPPVTLAVETTNICNADCIFCAYQYQEDFRKGHGVMTDEIFERSLTQFKEMGGRKIDFTPLVGDPLVDPKIISRVKLAKDMGFKVFFSLRMEFCSIGSTSNHSLRLVSTRSPYQQAHSKKNPMKKCIAPRMDNTKNSFRD